MRVDMLHVIIELLVPSQADLHVDRVVADDQSQTVIMEVTSTQTAPICPRCATAGSRVHSRYTRTLADLPWADVAVQVQVHVRTCFCVTETCSRRIFCERTPQIAQPWARRTRRLAAQQERIGVALGGAAGERLADDLDQPASRDTVIRLIRAHDLPAPPTPRILGSTIGRGAKATPMGRSSSTSNEARSLTCSPTARPRPLHSGCVTIPVWR